MHGQSKIQNHALTWRHDEKIELKIVGIIELGFTKNHKEITKLNCVKNRTYFKDLTRVKNFYFCKQVIFVDLTIAYLEGE